jgi:hypothetical protein
MKNAPKPKIGDFWPKKDEIWGKKEPLKRKLRLAAQALAQRERTQEVFENKGFSQVRSPNEPENLT